MLLSILRVAELGVVKHVFGVLQGEGVDFEVCYLFVKVQVGGTVGLKEWGKGNVRVIQGDNRV